MGLFSSCFGDIDDDHHYGYLKRSQQGGRRSVTKAMIGKPENFVHTGHLGIGTVRGNNSSLNTDPEKLKTLMSQVSAAIDEDTLFGVPDESRKSAAGVGRMGMSSYQPPSPSQCASIASSTPPRTQFPTHGLLPRIDTQASEFVRKNPSYDGRGTVVAVLDTGIDPGAQGLQITSDGKRKVLDFVDCTGSGDVVMGDPQQCISDALELRGASGRMLRLNPTWTNPSGEWRVGAKRLYDVAPQSVKAVSKRDREEKFRKTAQTLSDSVNTQLTAAKISKKDNTADTPTRKKDGTVDASATGKDDTVAELEAQAGVLSTLSGSYEDQGPMLDCVVFYDGTQWRAAIDAEADGDLSNAKALGAYKTTGDVALLSKRQLLYFTLNFYDNGRTLSIVTSAGPHSTHVAGILAANHPEEPQNNGVAPGAQLISLLIGDHRVASLETGVGLTRAVGAIIEHGADLANMSFGEPSATHNAGQWVQMVRKEVVRRHRCIFVSSAGNEGPALTTVGAPGGTTDGIIGVGAFVGEEQIKADHAMYDTVRDTAFTWCSRGPTFDGARGSDIFAPGSAIASYPAYTQQRLRLGNGTSMSSPNLCGCLALLVSAWKQEFGASGDSSDQPQKRISPYRVKNAIFATARAFGDELGAGLMQTDAAWQFLKKHSQREFEDVEYSISIPELNGARGIYLRNPEDSAQARHLKITVAPVFPEDADAKLERDPGGQHGQEDSQRRFDFEQRVLLVSDASWVRVPEALYVGSEGQIFNTQVDATQLEPGRLHIAAIEGYDSANVDRGPIFTVPITVTKPLEVGAGACVRLDSLRFQPTDIVRRFIAVPAGATRARITFHSGNTSVQASAPAVFYLHCLQISPQERFKTYELKQRVTAGHPSFIAGGKCAEQRYQCAMDVLGGATLEVCVAQFWNQLGNHEVDLTIDFNGISPVGAQYARAEGDRVNAGIVVNGNYGVVRTDFCANVRPEYNIKPKATLDVLRMTLRPQSAAVSPCDSERDIHPASGVAIHKLLLDYKLETKSDGVTIRPRLPALDTKIYESWADDFALAIFDVNKRRVASQISYTSNVTLRKRGSYLVRVQIRHRSEKDLESLKNIPLLIDMQLTNKVNLPTFFTLASAFTDTVLGSKPTVNTIAHGSSMPLFFKTDLTGLPAEASPGDVLYGSLTLSKLNADMSIEYIVPTKCNGGDKSKSPSSSANVSADVPADGKTLSPAEKERKEIEEAIRKLRIGWIKIAKDDSVREQLISELLAAEKSGDAAKEDKGDVQAAVLSAQLDTLDSMRKSQLPWSDAAKLTAESARRSVEVADRIVSLTYPQALTVRLYENQATLTNDEDKKQKQLAETAKDRLVCALTTKCRALAFLTTQAMPSSRSSETSVEFIDVISPCEDADNRLPVYEKAVSDLTKWTSEKQQADDAVFLMATLPLHIAKQNYGRALQCVMKWIGKAPLLESNTAERKAMTELRDLLVAKLGWSMWTDHFRETALVEHPATYEPL
ncbi:hypothetical protein EV178_002447 [Coemansia sp. RSA 1646]|nr:hypothetical protein EV178_002447 [Coemansia sp. RSA 1646]